MKALLSSSLLLLTLATVAVDPVTAQPSALRQVLLENRIRTGRGDDTLKTEGVTPRSSSTLVATIASDTSTPLIGRSTQGSSLRKLTEGREAGSNR
jgi:hypothetical protein